MADSDLMSPRKKMNMGGAMGGDDFGVEKLDKMYVHPDRNMDLGKTLPDKDRGTPLPVSRGPGQMKAEANSDHGPHYHPLGGKK